LLGFLRSRPVLLVAFAFAVMGDPVSSVAYAIEAALRALEGHLELLLPTMALVIAIIALVDVNYHQLVGRFPEGGGAAAAAGGAFGEAWAFIPMGTLIVDYVLTISISVAAGASAIIAFLPALGRDRDLLALLLLLLVAAPTWFGHGGRTAFALMTLAFVGVGSAVLVGGGLGGHPLRPQHVTALAHQAPLAIVLAFPVAMALATGTEAPSSAIAQLGQLNDAGRRRFGRVTLWLTLGIVGSFTLGITALAVRLGIGIPPPTARRSPTWPEQRLPPRSSPHSRRPHHCCCWPWQAPRSRRDLACSEPWHAAGCPLDRWPESWPVGWERPTATTRLTGASCSTRRCPPPWSWPRAPGTRCLSSTTQWRCSWRSYRDWWQWRATRWPTGAGCCSSSTWPARAR
jgi:hypothetical protein